MGSQARRNEGGPLKERKEVNSILHTLRGEHFRHSQNVRGSNEHLSNVARRSTGPSLPYSAIFGTEGRISAPDSSSSPVAGPVPRSWVQQHDARDIHNTVEGRQEALSLMFSHSGTSPGHGHGQASDGTSVPTLVNLCLRVLLDYCGPGREFAEDIVPFLSLHMRRELLRYTAVHCPLSNATLYSLFDPGGHADGEIIIVGPQASLRSDAFRPSSKEPEPTASSQSLSVGTTGPEERPEASWDVAAADDEWSTPGPAPIYSLILLATTLSVPTLLTLPPSLTLLALLHLPSAVPLHRLTGKCPQLEVLDLSYNSWLGTAQWGERGLFEQVAWNRWRHLRVFGCRECGITPEALREVNHGRWTEVEIIS
ncbi:hypothetical protein EVG20_g348 [Dentipellis fragilis]|uniref:Uncharacterized protein n=1 Tax=Dentipellis fragilis TaxID=205917 RepID=A0A4Y9ZFL3_9AGAM|nr:hypothetical protein EVG20_g348 [Dentipellis fragilis]